MEQSNSNIFLLHSEFANVVNYGTSPSIYTVDGWMNIGNHSDVPLAVLTDALEPFSLGGSVLRIGGTTGTNTTNQTFMVSSKVFKYNPTKYYRIRVRAKFTGSVAHFTAGFVGLTSNPVPDLVAFDSDVNWNAILNTSRCAFSPAGTSVPPNQNISNINHFNCISTAVTADGVYREYMGVIMGKADGSFNYSDTSYGLQANKPMPVRNEVLFFAPYFIANQSSTSEDSMLTFIDFITVEELTDTYVI